MSWRTSESFLDKKKKKKQQHITNIYIHNFKMRIFERVIHKYTHFYQTSLTGHTLCDFFIT